MRELTTDFASAGRRRFLRALPLPAGLVLLLALPPACSVAADESPGMGPLRVHPDNPRWFARPDGRLRLAVRATVSSCGDNPLKAPGGGHWVAVLIAPNPRGSSLNHDGVHSSTMLHGATRIA